MKWRKTLHVKDGWTGSDWQRCCLKVMCIIEPCAETWAQYAFAFSPLSFISDHHSLSTASFCFCTCGLHPFTSLIPSSFIPIFPLPVCLFFAQASSIPSLLPPSLALSPSISLHQLQRAVSVADLGGTCLLRWNKIIRPLVLLCACVCSWYRLL